MRRKLSNGSISNSELIEPVLRRLRAAPQVVLDLETSGLDWKTNHVCGYALAFGPAPDDSYYLPVRHAGGANLGGHAGPPGAGAWDGSPHPVERDLLIELARPGLTVVGHNLDFDLKMLHRLGHEMAAKYSCTQVNAALLDEYQGKFSLDYCAACAGVEAKQGERLKAYLKERFPEVKDKLLLGELWRLSGDDPVLTEYARADARVTWQLFDWQLPRLTDQDLDRVFDVECRLIPVLARMSLKGIRVDPERFTRLCAQIKDKLGELQAALPEGFNVRSPLNVRDWMERHGHTDWPLTAPSLKFPNGQPSFNEGWLERYPAGQQILDVRKYMTLRDSFVLPLQSEHIHRDRVHTTFHQMRTDDYGTITGRLSSSKPNLQQVSTHNEEIGRMHRSVFVPDEGLEWVDVDYSQCEPRLLAHYSRCKVLIDGYGSSPPIDAHQAVAMAFTPDWYELPPDQRKLRRELGKRCNQTILTGGGKGVLVKRYKMTEQDAARVFDDYFRTMPEIKDLQIRATDKMKARGYVTTLLGRRCRLQDMDKAFVAVNRLLQGGNADIIKLKMVQIDEYLRSEGRPLDLLLNCHDALSFQVPEGEDHHLEECLRIMTDFGPEQPIQVSVPITVDVGRGPSWDVAKFGEPK